VLVLFAWRLFELFSLGFSVAIFLDILHQLVPIFLWDQISRFLAFCFAECVVVRGVQIATAVRVIAERSFYGCSKL
jgi:hypothetical protein